VGGVRDFKFIRQVDRSKYQPSDDKPSLKGAWSGHVNHMKFGGTNYISGTAEVNVVKFWCR